MNTSMSFSAARGLVLPFIEKDKAEEESGTLESSLLQLIEDNRRSSLQLRVKPGKSREAIEIRALAVTVAKFGKQMDQWLTVTHAVNSVVEVYSLATSISLKMEISETAWQDDPHGTVLSKCISKHLPENIRVFRVVPSNK